MAQKSQWSTIEGGIANTFPLSINRTAYWTSLRRGECYYQDMTDRNRRGILSFSYGPQPASNFFIKKFVDSVTDTFSQLDAIFFYGRWWKVDILNPTRLYYSELGQSSANFSNNTYIDFIEDSPSPIHLLSPSSDGRVFIIKEKCGYVLDNANQSPNVWRKSAPDFSIGTVHVGPSATNAIIDNKLALIWNGGGEHGNRHYLWDGSNAAVELSEDIRELSEANTLVSTASINWSQQLIIFGQIVYDINARRVFNYSGADKASYTSRPFYQPMYNALTVYRLAFITNGNAGSFEAEIEYGQSESNLQKTKKFTVQIKPSTRIKFRHVWNLDIPIVCRVWRVKITNLTGCGISQIDADVSVNSNPDFEEAA